MVCYQSLYQAFICTFLIWKYISFISGIFSYFVIIIIIIFTFSLLSSAFWTSYSKIRPPYAGSFNFLSFSLLLSLCFPLSGRFLQPQNASVHFFISAIVFLNIQEDFPSVFNFNLFIFMHAVMQYFFLPLSFRRS